MCLKHECWQWNAHKQDVRVERKICINNLRLDLKRQRDGRKCKNFVITHICSFRK